MRRSTIKIALLSFAIALGAIALFAPQEKRRFRDGRVLAAHLIEIAKRNDGLVSAKELGDKICILPQGAYPPNWTIKFFPDAAVEGERMYLSDGYWFLLIGYDNARQVDVYSIPLNLIRWELSQVAPLHSNVACPERLRIIDTSQGAPKLQMKKE
jgi:hypothetical protein